MNKEEIDWTELDKRRNLLLSQSDWTQLPDTGLTIECVLAWREWRSNIRNINSSNYSSRLDAAVKLEQFGKAQPQLDFSGKKYNFFEKGEGSVYTRVDLSNMVRDILVDLLPTLQTLQTPPEPEPVEPVKELTVHDMPDIGSARKFVQKQLEASYRAKIKKSSPPTEMGQLYVERLNQAIDHLSGIGSSYPLLEVLSDNSPKTIHEIATAVLKKHSNMISTFVNIETEYLKSLKVIKESDKIDLLEKALENFNGH